MANKHLRPTEPRSVQLLRQAARVAEGVPVAGGAVRRFQDAEDWALVELKQRLDTLDGPAETRAPRERADSAQPAPSERVAQLLEQAQGLDMDAARQRMYEQVASQLVPEQVAMFTLLAERGRAPLCHVAASRLPAGPISMVVLANVSSLGRDAGILLRDYVPQYMTGMINMGLMEVDFEDTTMAREFEMLAAEGLVRNTMDRIREEMKLSPRIQRHTVKLTRFGQDFWRDCWPA